MTNLAISVQRQQAHRPKTAVATISIITVMVKHAEHRKNWKTPFSISKLIVIARKISLRTAIQLKFAHVCFLLLRNSEMGMY